MSFFGMKNISSAYGKTDVLHGINIEVGQDEIVTLIGSNGAGKSTTLMTIMGIVAKTCGEIIFDNLNITELEPHEIVKRGIVLVPEGRRIFHRLTVEENLRMGAFLFTRHDKSMFDKAFALFPILAERRRQFGGTLSGGEQQMLAIARALMSSPRLLLLDEPSLGIAPKLIERIFEALHKIHEEGTPILLVEQNAKLALEISDRAYVLENGKILISGTSREIACNEDVIKAYLGI
ncbi:MAG: branched-chain amino acid ABC transporter ATP-binding protein [Candidatus Hydrogenedentes bacterium CG07_land_8_20_14_0_80_42_17]|nr:MAG: branched-chain amino acid ABC transporter ATP-binding protein [Candidatus Hydrogenedentes bacterium CG1_02_42_14]PIU47618.1 MAG: branched-chain amino acid ABC transporter ATP-binding protein [Candidatus Hydrogenedentes bacterium CG07_land_8_20_14_0_80_42_17]